MYNATQVQTLIAAMGKDAALAFIAADLDLEAPASEKPAKKEKVTKVTLKPLSHGEIKALRRAGAEWVQGKTDWQLQGRKKPAGAVATGKVVPASVLAKHGFCRPTGHVRNQVKGN